MVSFSICSHPLQQGRKFYHLMVVQKLYITHYPGINKSNVKQISLENSTPDIFSPFSSSSVLSSSYFCLKVSKHSDTASFIWS